MKYCVVITDGASGNPLPQYGGNTSLEQATTPYLDAFAAEGLVGLAKTVPDSLEASSNVACTSICGYDPELYPIGRGALEGYALGVTLANDEVALRLNLTNVSPEGVMVSYSTDNISAADGHALLAELKEALDDEVFTLYSGTGFRGILVIKGHPLVMETTCHAAHDITDESIFDYPVKGPEAALLEDYAARAKKILAASPTNERRRAEGKMEATDVFAFWPGQRPSNMKSFFESYNRQAGMLSGVDLLNGIAGLANIKVYHFDGVTDGSDNDYAAQGEGTLAMLAEQDVVICHVESPDAEGHDGNAAGKIAAIEAIDREILSRLSTYAKSNPLRVLIMPDHPTPAELKRHTRDLVPFVLSGPGIAANEGTRLTEAEAASTQLVVNPGFALMEQLLA